MYISYAQLRHPKKNLKNRSLVSESSNAGWCTPKDATSPCGTIIPKN